LLAGNENHVLQSVANDNSDNIVVLKEFVLPVRAGIEIRRRALRHIENEARLLQSLDHPQIVKYIDSFVTGQRAYLALEHISGMSLRNIIQMRGQLKEGDAIKIAIKYVLYYRISS